jgi:hypothetical protein
MEEIFDLLCFLESDLIDLYQRVKKITRFSDSDVFERMIAQSEIHLKRISNAKENFNKPEFKRENVMKVQEAIKDALLTGTTKYDDDLKVYGAMTKAERNTGLLYEGIAKYYEKLAKHYDDVANEIKQISKEEFIHEEMLKKEYFDKHPEKKGIASLPSDNITFDNFENY